MAQIDLNNYLLEDNGVP